MGEIPKKLNSGTSAIGDGVRSRERGRSECADDDDDGDGDGADVLMPEIPLCASYSRVRLTLQSVRDTVIVCNSLSVKLILAARAVQQYTSLHFAGPGRRAGA